MADLKIGDKVNVKTHIETGGGKIIGYVVKLDKPQYESIGGDDYDYKYVITNYDDTSMTQLDYIITKGSIVDTSSAAGGGGQGGGKRRKTRKGKKRN